MYESFDGLSLFMLKGLPGKAETEHIFSSWSCLYSHVHFSLSLLLADVDGDQS